MVATSRSLALDLWMNGAYVGTWERPKGAADRLTYDSAWTQSRTGRPLSLSLPFSHARSRGDDVQALRGDKVVAYFENLIPDNERILQRLRDRYGARSTAPFDLLAAIGRDCVGAIQLLPTGTDPGDIRCIEATSLNEAGVATVLRNTTLSQHPGDAPEDERNASSRAVRWRGERRDCSHQTVGKGAGPSLGRVGRETLSGPPPILRPSRSVPVPATRHAPVRIDRRIRRIRCTCRHFIP
jgi:HipA-like protein